MGISNERDEEEINLREILIFWAAAPGPHRLMTIAGSYPRQTGERCDMAACPTSGGRSFLSPDTWPSFLTPPTPPSLQNPPANPSPSLQAASAGRPPPSTATSCCDICCWSGSSRRAGLPGLSPQPLCLYLDASFLPQLTPRGHLSYLFSL